MKAPQLQKVPPLEIEAESFRIIEAEIGPTTFTPRQFAVVRRCIHASGDFSFAENFRFHSHAFTVGLQAIHSGKNIWVDVTMAASGISKILLAPFGGQILCTIADPETAEYAQAHGLTRAEAAVERSVDEHNIGIMVVANAPTALLKIMDCIEQGRLAPDLVIGLPVGFVNAAESKALLAIQSYPFITSLGRKGGTPVAVATVNALLHLAKEGGLRN
jgi:precorrin-8X/cobalt-precorrin-8 methylmutase